MTRSDGFAVMDVSTDVVTDPKFRRVQRANPAHVAPAFMAYVGVLGESWKAGRRVQVADAWPVLIPYDPEVVGSLIGAGLLDGKGYIPAKAWEGWFREAADRRRKARERWRRHNANRSDTSTNNRVSAALEPRGNDISTASSVPTVPSVPYRTVRAVAGAREADPYDEAVQWLASRKAWVDGGKVQTELARMVDRKGLPAVLAAMAAVPGAEDGAQYVYGARNILYPLPGSVVAPSEPEPDPAAVRAQLRQRREAGS